MSNDILKDAILETAKKYVKDNVVVSVHENDPKNLSGKYRLQLINSSCSVSYNLHDKYVNSESYIMRVVSDLCMNIAKIRNAERDDFFKKSAIIDEKEWFENHEKDIENILKLLKNLEKDKKISKLYEHFIASKNDRKNNINNDNTQQILEENVLLKKHQDDFIKWLVEESKISMRDAGYHQKICLDILDKYQEIIRGDF